MTRHREVGTPPLSEATEDRIALLFAPAHRQLVRAILLDECGNNLPLCADTDAVAMDRFRFAALKLSGGHMAKLRDAVRLAKLDWRDLLIAAEFADDPKAHNLWMPARSW